MYSRTMLAMMFSRCL